MKPPVLETAKRSAMGRKIHSRKRKGSIGDSPPPHSHRITEPPLHGDQLNIYSKQNLNVTPTPKATSVFMETTSTINTMPVRSVWTFVKGHESLISKISFVLVCSVLLMASAFMKGIIYTPWLDVVVYCVVYSMWVTTCLPWLLLQLDGKTLQLLLGTVLRLFAADIGVLGWAAVRGHSHILHRGLRLKAVMEPSLSWLSEAGYSLRFGVVVASVTTILAKYALTNMSSALKSSQQSKAIADSENGAATEPGGEDNPKEQTFILGKTATDVKLNSQDATQRSQKADDNFKDRTKRVRGMIRGQFSYTKSKQNSSRTFPQRSLSGENSPRKLFRENTTKPPFVKGKAYVKKPPSIVDGVLEVHSGDVNFSKSNIADAKAGDGRSQLQAGEVLSQSENSVESESWSDDELKGQQREAEDSGSLRREYQQQSITVPPAGSYVASLKKKRLWKGSQPESMC